LFSSERWRKWFYYNARQGMGGAHGMLVAPGRKVVVIGDAIKAGKAKEAIASAFQAAYGR
jgi:orotate phosphoribosyltransferase